MPIFRVKSVKIYTGQKKFTRVYSWLSWQISGMHFFPRHILTRKIKKLLQCFDPSKSACIIIKCHVCPILWRHYSKYLTCKSFLDTVFDISCSTTALWLSFKRNICFTSLPPFDCRVHQKLHCTANDACGAVGQYFLTIFLGHLSFYLWMPRPGWAGKFRLF